MGVLRSIRLDFALPRTRRRLVQQPLVQHLATNKNTPDYAKTAFRIGVDAAFLGRKTIKTFVRQNQLSQKHQTSLLSAARSLILSGILQIACKLAWLASAAIAAFYFASSDSSVSPKQASQQSKFPTALTLSIQDEKYLILETNGWYQKLHQACSSYFIEPNLLTYPQLSQCFEEQMGTPLNQTGFLPYLRNLDRITVILTPEMRQQVREVYAAVQDAPTPKLKSKSTGSEDYLIKPTATYINYAQHYRQTYGATAVNPPSWIKEVDYIQVLNYKTAIKGSVPADYAPVLFRLLDFEGTAEEAVCYATLNIEEGRLSRPTGFYLEALALVEYLKPETQIAAQVIYKYHGKELPYNLIEIALHAKLLGELVLLRNEDPWQDIGACQWSGCSLLESFNAVFNGVEYGVFLGNKLTRPSWRLASQLHTPMEQQGFGPCQVILGLFKEASEDQRIRQHWKEILSDIDFSDNKSIMRILLERPTIAYAFVLDFILSRLEETVYSDPKIRAVATFPPFIENDIHARQLSLMSTALVLAAFPEEDENANLTAMVIVPNATVFNLTRKLLERPPLIPELEFNYITTVHKEEKYLTALQ